MPVANVDLVRSLQERWNRGDTAVDEKFFHPDVEFIPQRSATEGAYTGLSGIEKFVADTLDVFDRFEMRYEYADLGGRVLAWGTIHFRAKGSGVETDIESGGIFEFRDGKIARWQDFGSKPRALAAAGVDEPLED